MTQLSYSFCIAMLHSFWQAGLLLLLCLMIDKIVLQKSPALVKRNLLFLTLTLQVALFFVTFFIYFFTRENNFASGSVNKIVTRLLSAENIYTYTSWLFLGYILIITYKIIQTIYTWHQFGNHYKHNLQKPPIDLKLFTNLKAYHFGIKRNVKIWCSNNISVPVTFGFFKPVILLPVALINNIDIKQAETLILHELAHIKSNDYLLNLYLIFADNIFFFNPFIAIICNKIRFEREKHCDMSVIAFDYSPTLYAETLLQAERVKQLIPTFQLAAVNNKKQLLHRIQFFTSNNNLKKQNNTFIAPLLSSLLLMALSVILLFQSLIFTTSTTNKVEAEATSFLFSSKSITETGSPVYTNNILPNKSIILFF